MMKFYLNIRKGILNHKDTKGNSVKIGVDYLMLMKSGTGIYYQESVPLYGEDVEMIQIFKK